MSTKNIIFKKRFAIDSSQIPKNLEKEETLYDVDTLCDFGVLFWKRTRATQSDSVGLFFELSKDKYEEYKDNPNILIGVSCEDIDWITLLPISKIDKGSSSTVDFGFPNIGGVHKDYVFYVYFMDRSWFDPNNTLSFGSPSNRTFNNACNLIFSHINTSSADIETYEDILTDTKFISYIGATDTFVSLYKKYGHHKLLENLYECQLKHSMPYWIKSHDISYSDVEVFSAIMHTDMNLTQLLRYLVYKKKYQACCRLFDFYGFNASAFDCKNICEKIVKRDARFMFDYFLQRKAFSNGASYKALKYAFENGNLYIIQKLMATFGLQFDHKMLKIAKQYNHVDVLEYFEKIYGNSIIQIENC